MAALLNKLCINQAFNQMPKGKLLEEIKFLFPARKKFVSLIASRLSTEKVKFMGCFEIKIIFKMRHGTRFL